MRNFIRSGKYHVNRILFEKFGLPKVLNEKISKVVLKKYLPTYPVIIDCGAHDGSDTVELAKMFKGATIHAFEPVGNLFNKLKQRPNPNNNIQYYQLALADKNGIMDFNLSEGRSDASSSLLLPITHLKDHPDTTFNNKTLVQTMTLDSWAMKYQVEKVDLLWLDMQGYELQMLKESQFILDTVSVIHTEVSTRETYKGVVLYEEYRIFLEEKGFRVIEEAIPEGWDMGNVLFLRDRKN
jgi:FkbM family methyltransferase